MMIQVKFNIGGFARAMELAYQDQIPFATALALTRTAKLARLDLQKSYEKQFITRNRYTTSHILFNKATKRDLKAEVGHVEEYVRQQVVGGVRVGSQKGGMSRSIPRPVIRKTERSLIPVAKRPQNILDSGQGFKVRPKGTKGFWIARRKKVSRSATRAERRALTMLYHVPKVVRIKGVWDMEDVVRRTVARVWAAETVKAIDQALSTAKKGKR